jgi:hypothetical protein
MGQFQAGAVLWEVVQHARCVSLQCRPRPSCCCCLRRSHCCCARMMPLMLCLQHTERVVPTVRSNTPVSCLTLRSAAKGRGSADRPAWLASAGGGKSKTSIVFQFLGAGKLSPALYW